MKYCKNCQIKYDSPINKCLLCQNNLEKIDDDIEINNFTKHIKKKKTLQIIFKSFIVLNIISIVTTLLINYYSSKQFTWGLIVSISNIFLVLIIGLIISKAKTSTKISGSILLATILTIIISFIIENYHWAIDIVLPFSLIFITFINTIITLSKKSKWQDHISMLLISSFLNIIIFILNIVNVTNTKWAITGSLLYGVITILALLIFSPKDLKEEFLRRFHT